MLLYLFSVIIIQTLASVVKLSGPLSPALHTACLPLIEYATSGVCCICGHCAGLYYHCCGTDGASYRHRMACLTDRPCACGTLSHAPSSLLPSPHTPPHSIFAHRLSGILVPGPGSCQIMARFGPQFAF
jgi:hypothetical protein